jgi:hypothetical protein
VVDTEQNTSCKSPVEVCIFSEGEIYVVIDVSTLNLCRENKEQRGKCFLRTKTLSKKLNSDQICRELFFKFRSNPFVLPVGAVAK